MNKNGNIDIGTGITDSLVFTILSQHMKYYFNLNNQNELPYNVILTECLISINSTIAMNFNAPLKNVYNSNRIPFEYR